MPKNSLVGACALKAFFITVNIWVAYCCRKSSKSVLKAEVAPVRLYWSDGNQAWPLAASSINPPPTPQPS